MPEPRDIPDVFISGPFTSAEVKRLMTCLREIEQATGADRDFKVCFAGNAIEDARRKLDDIFPKLPGRKPFKWELRKE